MTVHLVLSLVLTWPHTKEGIYCSCLFYFYGLVSAQRDDEYRIYWFLYHYTYSRLIYMPEHYQGHRLKNIYKPVDKDLPCDIHVVNLRTMITHPLVPAPSDQAALILHRQGFTSAYRPLGMTCATNGGKISMDELFPELYSTNVKQMSLSLMYDGMKMEKSFTVSIQPMELYSFLLTR